jgi:hypothetical protein
MDAMLGTALTITQAISIRDAGVDDREIVVTGFLGGAGLRLPCPMVLLPKNPTRLDCPQGFAWLMLDPESLTTTFPDGSGSNHPPVGPAIHPSFALVDQPARANVRDGAESPTPMTVVGHFDDRRAESCPAADVAACRDTFVIDRVVDATDLDVPATTVADDTPSRESSAVAVDRLVQGAAPGVAVLANRVVGGGLIGAAEPALAADPTWTSATVVWIVTALSLRDGTPVARTFVAIDGKTNVLEMTAAGPIRPATAPQNAPPASNTPDATVITDLLDHPVSVAEAIDRRDTALEDTELAVEGFGWGPSGLLSCPMIRPGLPVKAQCPGSFTWISDRQPAPTVYNEFAQPAGPAFNLLIQPETIRAVDIYRPDPIRIIALGHFDDHRSATCLVIPDECRKNFIVDAIVDPAERRIDRTIVIGRVDPSVRPVLTPAEALGRMGLTATDPRLVVAFAVRVGALQEIEPFIAYAKELGGAEVVWIARWVDRDAESRPVLRTKITIDVDPAPSETQTWRVTAEGLEPVAP